MFSCPAVRNALGDKFSNLNLSHFFLAGFPNWFQTGMLCVLYALYTWSNHARHNPALRFKPQSLWRLADNMAFCMKLRTWPLCKASGSVVLGG